MYVHMIESSPSTQIVHLPLYQFGTRVRNVEIICFQEESEKPHPKIKYKRKEG